MRCGAGSLAGSQVCPGWVDSTTLPKPPLEFSPSSRSDPMNASGTLPGASPSHTEATEVRRLPEEQRASLMMLNKRQFICSASHIPGMRGAALLESLVSLTNLLFYSIPGATRVCRGTPDLCERFNNWACVFLLLHR